MTEFDAVFDVFFIIVGISAALYGTVSYIKGNEIVESVLVPIVAWGVGAWIIVTNVADIAHKLFGFSFL